MKWKSLFFQIPTFSLKCLNEMFTLRRAAEECALLTSSGKSIQLACVHGLGHACWGADEEHLREARATDGALLLTAILALEIRLWYWSIVVVREPF